MKRDVTRRTFLEGIGSTALGGSMLAQVNERAAGQSAAWRKPLVLTNPNILIILVDQMRWPAWLTFSQLTTLDQTYLVNIVGQLRNRSYVFDQYYTAATVCTAARGTLLTGLYAPQSALYVTNYPGTTPTPSLNPAFPTWGGAIQALNPAYQDKVWWFGKWHLSDCLGLTNPLKPYGFSTRTFPGQGNPSPDGAANE
jgi:arylsulfatase A-like enzyme